MKKRTIVMSALLTAAMTLPLGKDYANSGLEEKLPIGIIEVGKPLDPREQLFLLNDSATIEAIVNRDKYYSENLVDQVLDTISNYTSVVNKEFIRASIQAESWFNPKEVSPVGARGLGQFMEDTWKTMGEGSYNNAFNPIANIKATIKYNKYLENYIAKRNPEWDSLTVTDKQKLIAAAYNGGHGTLKDAHWKLDRMPAESKAHADKIVGSDKDKILGLMKNHREEMEIVKAYYYVDPEKLYTKQMDSLINNLWKIPVIEEKTNYYLPM